MVYNDKKQKSIRRKLRNNQTDAEQYLWQRLRRKQIDGHRFVRQYGIGKVIVDFYCPRSRLAIELDGGQHNAEKSIKKDQDRNKHLKQQDVKTLRFWNNDVFNKTEEILAVIESSLKK